MNQEDREHLSRIETKIDTIDERGIRTEEKVTAHLKDHTNRVRWGLAVVGTVGTIISAFIIGLGKSIWAWILELITK